MSKDEMLKREAEFFANQPEYALFLNRCGTPLFEDRLMELLIVTLRTQLPSLCREVENRIETLQREVDCYNQYCLTKAAEQTEQQLDDQLPTIPPSTTAGGPEEGDELEKEKMKKKKKNSQQRMKDLPKILQIITQFSQHYSATIEGKLERSHSPRASISAAKERQEERGGEEGDLGAEIEDLLPNVLDELSLHGGGPSECQTRAGRLNGIFTGTFIPQLQQVPTPSQVFSQEQFENLRKNLDVCHLTIIYY
jgi:hypothetical protein